MLILGIETSGSIGGVALMEDGQLLGKRCLAEKGRRHAQTLVSETAVLFRETNRSPADCQGVAVSVGPGSFTGLRIGVVFAKTFAYSVGCPSTAVDTLGAMAEDSPANITRLTVIADAQRGDLYVGRYVKVDKLWSRDGAITMHPAVEWCQNVPETETVAGPGLDRWERELQDRCRLVSDLRVPKATTICRIGARQLRAGEVADLWGLEPYYLRKSSAEEQWDLRHPPE